MSREVLSSEEYQYLEQGYLVDNIPWQEEIKKRLEVEAGKKMAEARPTLGVEEFQPLFLPENPEAEEVLETPQEPEVVMPPEPTAEEILAKARTEAEETAKSIEQAAKKNAFEIVEKARWESDDLLTKAKEDAEKEIQHLKETASAAGREVGLKEGFEKGNQEGFEKGRAEGQATYSDLVKKWNGVLEETVSQRKQLLGELRPVLVELVGQALRHCLKKEAERSGQVAVEFAEEALKKAQDRVHLKLHLNPEDVEEVEAQRERLQLTVGAAELELVPDARIDKGGCVLETEAGSVDVRLSTVVAQVQESINSEMLKS
jgi:flagellar assembly protein FliH